MKSKGTLIPIGGNENKGTQIKEKFHTERIEKGILSRVVAESGGADALIAIIPTASSIPVQVSKSYIEAFGKLGCKDIQIVDIRSREDSEKQEYIDIIKNADCIMFSGGNQSEIINKIKDSSIHEILSDRYHNSSLVIAGTSAGAMCMSEEMITGGRHKEAFS